MTRRILRPQPNSGPNGHMVDLGGGSWGLSDGILSGEWKLHRAGDLLWVRESCHRKPDLWHYDADDSEVPWPQRQTLAGRKLDYSPSIHMPRTASRITLRVTGVKVERLQEIGEADAMAEGVEKRNAPEGNEVVEWTHKQSFAGLWESIHGHGAWAANPWVAAISFERLPPPTSDGGGE